MNNTLLFRAGLVTVMLLTAGRLFAGNQIGNPERAAEHYSRALTYMQKGALEEATWEFRNVVLCDPENARAHYDLGFALSLKGVTDEVVSEYRKAVRLQPDFLEALMQLAESLDAKGERKQARGYWKKAEKIAGGDASCQVYEVLIKKRLAEPD